MRSLMDAKRLQIIRMNSAEAFGRVIRQLRYAHRVSLTFERYSDDPGRAIATSNSVRYFGNEPHLTRTAYAILAADAREPAQCRRLTIASIL